MGFYPVAPGSPNYALGSPSVKNARLNLENGKTFTVETVNQNEKNVYVQRVLLNGTPLSSPTITHDQIMQGSAFTYYMSNKPDKNNIWRVRSS